MNSLGTTPVSPYRSSAASQSNSELHIGDSEEIHFPFPFTPLSIPPPPEFPGCVCEGDCTCKYESLKFLTSEGLFLPFAPPRPVEPPRVCVWMHLSRDDIKRLEEDSFSKQAAFSVFEKRFPVVRAEGKEMLWELLFEAFRYSRVNGFSAKQTSSLVSIYYNTHTYYTSSQWRLPDEVYSYFKECLLLHTVQHPPKSAEILDPMQSYHALKHFIKTYLRQLPLVEVASLPQMRLQLIWPLMVSMASSSFDKEEDGGEGTHGLHTAATSVSQVGMKDTPIILEPSPDTSDTQQGSAKRSKDKRR